MRTNDPASIRDLLDQAEVLADTYADYDTEAARKRVNAQADCPSSVAAASCTAGLGPEVPRPAAAHEQAARDLDLAVALIVDTPQAATALARLADRRSAVRVVSERLGRRTPPAVRVHGGRRR
ncbi:hypothetical protein AB0R12_37070, partial [Streptomyces niveus]